MTQPQRLCLNCDTPLVGAYCAQCGQRDAPADPTLRELVGEAWEAMVSIDGKVVSSLRLLLTRPGELTAEYLRGHRARHLPPLRLYLACSVVYFLVSASVPRAGPPPQLGLTMTEDGRKVPLGQLSQPSDSARRETLISLGREPGPGPLDSASRALADSVRLERKIQREIGPNPGWFERVVLTRFIRNARRVSADQESYGHRVKEQVPRLMFVLMPVFAAMLAAAYRSRRRRYPTHLIVALHLHAFLFAMLALAALAGALPIPVIRRVVLAAVLLWAVVYMPLALRRVYGGRLWLAALRAATLMGTYAAFAALVVTVVALALVVVA